MRFSILASVAALGLAAACSDQNANDPYSDEAMNTAYGTSADEAAAQAAAEAAAAANSAAAAADAAAADARVAIEGEDSVTVEVGPDGTRVSGSVQTEN